MFHIHWEDRYTDFTQNIEGGLLSHKNSILIVIGAVHIERELNEVVKLAVYEVSTANQSLFS